MGNINASELRRLSKHVAFGSTSWARRHRHVLAPHVGVFTTATLIPLLVALSGCSWAKLPIAVSEYIERYVPKRVDAPTWKRIAPFVRDSVTLAAPETEYTAEVLIGRVSHYVAWCVGMGWPLDGETIWSRQGIDLYLADKRTGISARTSMNYRGLLLKVARVLEPELNDDPPKPISASRALPTPYTAAEMAGFRRWASQQRTHIKRRRAMLMLVLCAGAGLRGVDIANLKPEHVERLTDGGYIIHVGGRRGRDVPLLAEWDDWMDALLERVPNDHETLWGTPNKSRPNSLLSGFAQNSDGFAPTARRLRETWMVTVLGPLPQLKSVFRAAGLVKFEHLFQLLFYVEDISADEYVRFLRQEERS